MRQLRDIKKGVLKETEFPACLPFVAWSVTSFLKENSDLPIINVRLDRGIMMTFL